MEDSTLWRSVPITALFRVPDTDLVLAGQGGCARLLSLTGNDGLNPISINVLGSTLIHGFTCIAQATDEQEWSLVAWGANHVRALKLTFDSTLHWMLIAEGQVVDVIDWVFSLCGVSNQGGKAGQNLVYLLNAHNEVRVILRTISEHGVSLQYLPSCFIERRLVMLYNGHISIINGRLVVAAGTMFGQVLFEVYDLGSDPPAESLQAKVVTRDVFHDHEGSVFGVSVLGRQINTQGKASYRLASCSDDRTVRVYEIPETVQTNFNAEEDARTGFIDFLDLPTATPRANTGTAMGHESRIWSVLWLTADENESTIMTFGEDTTAQNWTIRHVQSSTHGRVGQQTSVVNTGTRGFHSGKNIWAASVSTESDNRVRVCTGGADGRIASYCLDQGPAPTTAEHARASISHDELAQNMVQDSSTHVLTDLLKAKSIFAALEGRWTLKRTISSKRPEYPSGEFIGEATLSRRPPSSDEFQSEMTYEEEGQFTFASGPTLTARRRYIYRYHESTGSITAWFVKPEHSDTVDYLFHKVNFSSSTETREDDTTYASGYHLCIADHYNAAYEFVPGEQGLRQWSLSYNVQGPQKDYVARATYEPADTKPPKTIRAGLRQKADSFRSYTWLSHNECLITTDHGYVLSAFIDDNQRTTLRSHAQLNALKSYSLTTTLNSQRILIAAANGELFQYSSTTGKISLVHAFGSKIVSLTTIASSKPESAYVLVKCLKDTQLHLCEVAESRSAEANGEFNSNTAETPKGFVATSAAFLDDRKILAVGSRSNGLSLWRITNIMDLIPINECHSRFVHGQNAITSIIPLDIRVDSEKEKAIRFATTGRNGTFHIHHLNSADSIETIHSLRWPFGPNLEGAALTSNVTLWGFDGTDFVVINQSRSQEVMRVTCGNGHRNWAFNLDTAIRDDFRGSLVWTQANSCHFKRQLGGSHGLLAAGGHGREIKALAATTDSDGEVVATGAEDTDIKIFTTTKDTHTVSQTHPLRYQATLARHKTGLTSLKFYGNNAYLFSAGGKEELFLWKVKRMPQPLGVTVTFEAEFPKVEDGLLRVTDFCFLDFSSSGSIENNDDDDSLPAHLAVVYSDSSLRIWRCDRKPPTFVEVSGGRYTQHCLTCVDKLGYLGRGKVTLITASTDGYLAIWDAYTDTPTETPPAECTVIQKHKTHDNAIKAMLVHESIVVTGSDDGAVGITFIKPGKIPSEPRFVVEQTRIPRAHAAAVNTIALVDWRVDRGRCNIVVASSGSDQVVVAWRLSVKDGWQHERDVDLQVSRQSCRTAVADVSGVVKLQGGLLVTGVGMEVLRHQD